MRYLLKIFLTYVLVVEPTALLAQEISDYLIEGDIGRYKYSEGRLFYGEILNGPKIYKDGTMAEGISTVYESFHIGGDGYSEVHIQVKVFDSTQWLIHNVEELIRKYEKDTEAGLDILVGYSKYGKLRKIGNNIIFWRTGGTRSYRWIHDNLVIEIYYSDDLVRSYPEPLEVIEAYLRKWPSTIPSSLKMDRAHNKKWIKDEMERRLWLSERWFAQLDVKAEEFDRVLREVRDHLSVFLQYRVKYFAEDMDLERIYVDNGDLTTLRTMLVEFQEWWEEHKSESIRWLFTKRLRSYDELKKIDVRLTTDEIKKAMEKCSSVGDDQCVENLDKCAAKMLHNNKKILVDHMVRIASTPGFDINDYKSGKLFDVILKYIKYTYGDESDESAKMLFYSRGIFKNTLKWIENVERAKEIAQKNKNYEFLIEINSSMYEYYREMNDYSGAEKAINEQLLATECLYGENHAEVGQLLGSLASFYSDNGQIEKYESSINRKIEVYKILDPAKATRIAVYFAENYLKDEKYHAAQIVLERALEHAISCHINYDDSIMKALTYAYTGQKKYEEALSVALKRYDYEKENRRNSEGFRVLESLRVLKEIAWIYCGDGRYEKSIATYIDIVDKSNAYVCTPTADDKFTYYIKSNVQESYFRMAEIYYNEIKDYEKALYYYNLVKAIGEHNYGPCVDENIEKIQNAKLDRQLEE